MELLAYLFKVSVCTIVFFAFYLVVLRRLTFFKINRFYLLTTLVLSFVIPAFQISIERVDEPILEPEIEETRQVFEQQQRIQVLPDPIIEEQINWLGLVPYAYSAIAFIVLSLSAFQLFQLIKYANSHKKVVIGLKLVPKTEGFTNCSFFNYVFINNDNLTEPELQILLRHEQVHAKQYHSIDKLLMMVFKAVLWFNPMVYLYDKALEQVHEYEADEITSQNFGNQLYANLMLKLAISNNQMSLVHSFVKSPIKERIKMLFNSKTKSMKKLMYLLALPLGLLLIWSFTINIKNVLPEKLDKKFTLVIDAGHGGDDKGAVVNGYQEKDLTLKIAQEIKKIGKEEGLNVVLTRDKDETLKLSKRAKVQGDILISLHLNTDSVAGAKNGIELITSSDHNKADKVELSKSLAIVDALYKNLTTLNGVVTRKAPVDNHLLVLNESKKPSVLVELGYLTDKKDLQFITNGSNQNMLAKAIVNAVISYSKALKSDRH